MDDNTYLTTKVNHILKPMVKEVKEKMPYNPVIIMFYYLDRLHAKMVI